MKKLAACLSVVSIAVFSLMSCSKRGNHTCTCVVPGVGNFQPALYRDVKNSEAKKSCGDLQNQALALAAGSTCTLSEQ